MVPLLFGLVFIGFPLLELALLIKTGQSIGLWPTLAIVAGTAVVGVHVLARQSWTAARQMQDALARGEPPVAPVVDGAFLIGAGMLLITPGLICDAIGLLLLIPPIRHMAARGILRRMLAGADVRVYRAGTEDSTGRYSPRAPPGTGPLIEGDFERLDDKATGPHRPRGSDHV
jgi:UPF0716 protein FxsA